MEYFPEVVQSVAAPNHRVYAYFTDGRVKLVDVRPLIERGGIFSRLEDEEFFRNRITVLNGTVAWDLSGRYDPTDCIDLDPWVIYEKSPTVPDPLEQMHADDLWEPSR